jgi:hypothetical protein
MGYTKITYPMNVIAPHLLAETAYVQDGKNAAVQVRKWRFNIVSALSRRRVAGAPNCP